MKWFTDLFRKAAEIEAETPITVGNTMLQEIHFDLHRLSLLDDDWDYDGARSIRPGIVAAAKDFATKYVSLMRVKPWVVPMSCGRIQFGWLGIDGRDLELEFHTPKSLIYLKAPSKDHNSWIVETISVHDDFAITSLLKWLFEEVHATE
jgi:hypothetical protein